MNNIGIQLENLYQKCISRGKNTINKIENDNKKNNDDIKNKTKEEVINKKLCSEKQKNQNNNGPDYSEIVKRLLSMGTINSEEECEIIVKKKFDSKTFLVTKKFYSQTVLVTKFV